MAAEEHATVRCDVADGIATIVLDRPRVLNAFNHAQRIRFTEAMERAAEEPTVRVIVLRGEGRCFCAGQDQKESAGFDEAAAQRRLDTYERLFATMRACTRPIIAQLHGHAAGAGFQLALMADIRIAGASTKLGMTELKIGSPPVVGSAMLRPVIGDSLMRWMILTAEFVDAQAALRMGLVHESVTDDDLPGRVAAVAQRLAEWDPGPVARVKRWLSTMSEDLFAESWRQAKIIHRENFLAGSLSGGARKFVSREKV